MNQSHVDIGHGNGNTTMQASYHPYQASVSQYGAVCVGLVFVRKHAGVHNGIPKEC